LRNSRRHRRQEGRHGRFPREARAAIQRALKRPINDQGNHPMANENIFSGLKVVDFSSFVAAPGAAVILSDFGADVIKVEPPQGDTWRKGNQPPIQPMSEDPYQWDLANRNKRSIALNLKSPSAQQVLF